MSPVPAAGNPATMYTPNGQQHVFYRGTDNNIWQVFYDPNHGPNPHGPEQWTFSNDVQGDPATLYTPNGQQHVFYRTDKDEIWQVFYDPNHDPNPHGPEMWDTGALGDPATMYTPHQQHVFYQKYSEGVKGTGINIYHVFYDEERRERSNPAPWLPIWAPDADSKPATLYTPNGQQHVFYRGIENNELGTGGYIYQVFFDPDGQSLHGPEMWGSYALNNLATLYTPNGQQHVFYLTVYTNGGISHLFFDPGSNSLHGPEIWPTSPGYGLTGDPATMYTPNGQQHVFYRGTDNNVWQVFYDEQSKILHSPEQWTTL